MEFGTFQKGIEDDLFHLVGDHRRLLVGLADDDAGGNNRRAFLDDAQRELGDVDRHVERPKVVRQPAPALHID